MQEFVLTANRTSTVSAPPTGADTVVSNTVVQATVDQGGTSDSDLLLSFCNGNEQAFVELYKRRHLEIYRYILHFVHGDEQMAADIFQDTFIKVHSHLHTLREGGNVRAWIYAIARNACINSLKKNNRQIRLDDIHNDIEDRGGMLPDLAMHRNHLYAELDRAIAGLPENQREAILLREYEGLSYSEIADATRTNVGVVRQRLWRAKQSLRNSLASFFPGSSGEIGEE